MAAGFNYPKEISDLSLLSGDGVYQRLNWRIEHGKKPKPKAWSAMLGFIKSGRQARRLLTLLRRAGLTEYYAQARLYFKAQSMGQIPSMINRTQRGTVWLTNMVDAVVDIPLTPTAGLGVALFKDAGQYWLSSRVFRIFSNKGEVTRVPTKAGHWLQIEAIPAYISALQRLYKRWHSTRKVKHGTI